MYYATHRLYISKDNFLRLHVVELKDGEVVSFFPFDGERESMIWVDNILICEQDMEEYQQETDCSLKKECSAKKTLYAYSVRILQNGTLEVTARL